MKWCCQQISAWFTWVTKNSANVNLAQRIITVDRRIKVWQLTNVTMIVNNLCGSLNSIMNCSQRKTKTVAIGWNSPICTCGVSLAKMKKRPSAASTLQTNNLVWKLVVNQAQGETVAQSIGPPVLLTKTSRSLPAMRKFGSENSLKLGTWLQKMVLIQQRWTKNRSSIAMT